MPLLDDLLGQLPLGNPAFHNLLYSIFAGGRRGRSEQERHRQLLAKLDALSLPTDPAHRPGPAAVPMVAPTAQRWGGGIGQAREVIVAASGNLKEALRFAREPRRPEADGQDPGPAGVTEIGLDHPQARMRLDDAAAAVADLERFVLAPERLRGLPPQERAAIEDLLPDLRRLRQALGDASTDLSHRYTVPELEDLAAEAGILATRARVAAALATPARPLAAVGPTPAGNPYALDADYDTACIACGDGHWAAVDSGLGASAGLAERAGFTDPAVQARLTTVEEELEMLTRWDWTKARIAATPPADRAILEVYAPAAQALYEQVRSARTPADLAAAAARAKQLRADFAAAVRGRPTEGAMRPRAPVMAARGGNERA